MNREINEQINKTKEEKLEKEEREKRIKKDVNNENDIPLGAKEIK